MLSHHVSRAAVVVSSQPSLPRALAVELASVSFCRNDCHRRQYSNSTSVRQWAVTNRRAVAPNLRQRRPIVNGEAVPFHINDLLRTPRPSSSSHLSSFSASPNTTSVRHSPASVVLNEHATPSRYYDSDLVVVLDLDECLVHSQFSTSQNAQVFAHQLLKQKRLNPTSAARPGSVDSFRMSLPDGDLVHVNLRPGVREFLEAVTARFETHIFTAAVDVYASPLLDLLDPRGALAGRWYREHCVFDPTKPAYVKDLDRLPFASSLDRVVLVDNNPLSFLANPSNGILVSSFYNDPDDTSLQNVWQLLQELDEHPDVRPHLDERFGLKSALSALPNTAAQQRKFWHG